MPRKKWVELTVGHTGDSGKRGDRHAWYLPIHCVVVVSTWKRFDANQYGLDAIVQVNCKNGLRHYLQWVSGQTKSWGKNQPRKLWHWCLSYEPEQVKNESLKN